VVVVVMVWPCVCEVGMPRQHTHTTLPMSHLLNACVDNTCVTVNLCVLCVCVGVGGCWFSEGWQIPLPGIPVRSLQNSNKFAKTICKSTTNTCKYWYDRHFARRGGGRRGWGGDLSPVANAADKWLATAAWLGGLY